MGSAKLNSGNLTGQIPGGFYFYFSFYYFSAVCPVTGEV